MQGFRQSHISRINTERIISGYASMVKERTDEGWNGYLLTFMFNAIGGSEPSVTQQMLADVERVYRTSLTRIVRNPTSGSQAGNLPIWLTFPDYPVFKWEKEPLSDVALNDGLHIGGIALLPPVNRLEYGLDDHFLNNRRLYVRRGSPLQRVQAKLIIQTPEQAADYTLKALKRGRVTLDDILLLPVSRDEIRRKNERNEHTSLPKSGR